MNPTPGDVHVSTPLTNVSIAFLQRQTHFIADQVFPNVPVTKQSDRYYVYDRGYFNRDEMQQRAPGAESAGGHYTVDNTPTYFAPVWAFHHDIPDQVRGNQDAVLDADRESTELCTHKALIRRERSWVSRYFTTGVWATDITGVAGVPAASQTKQWNDAASDPIADVRAGKTAVLRSTGFEPNTLVIGYEVMNALIDHPEIVDRTKYGQMPGGPAVPDLSEIAQILKIERVLVSKAIHTTSAENQTNVHAFIGTKSALLCYAAPSPALMTPSAGYTFSWTGYLGASPQGHRIKRFRMEPNASDRVEVEMAFDHKLVAADLGYFFTTIVA